MRMFVVFSVLNENRRGRTKSVLIWMQILQETKIVSFGDLKGEWVFFRAEEKQVFFSFNSNWWFKSESFLDKHVK